MFNLDLRLAARIKRLKRILFFFNGILGCSSDCFAMITQSSYHEKNKTKNLLHLIGRFKNLIAHRNLDEKYELTTRPVIRRYCQALHYRIIPLYRRLIIEQENVNFSIF